MKICDVCKTSDGEAGVQTVRIGADMGLMSFSDGELTHSLSAELCHDCLVKVTEHVSESLTQKFGNVFRA